MQSMIKTSRLEAGVIALEPKPQMIYDTLATALGGILLNAEQKNVAVTVDCPETISAIHDRKWTSEALFNILDNAVCRLSSKTATCAILSGQRESYYPAGH